LVILGYGYEARTEEPLMKFKSLLVSFLKLSLSLSLIFIAASPSIAQTKDPGKVVKVAILPFQIHSQENLDYLREGIYDILSSRITGEGEIVVIERSIIERAFYEERPMRLDEAVAKRIGMRAGADYIVLGSLTKVGDYISLDARLISITEEKPPLGVYTQHKGIQDVMVKIGDFAQEIGYKILGRRAMAARPTESRHPYLTRPKGPIERFDADTLGFKKSQGFGFEIKGLDIGDVDGDRKNEVVIMDRNHLYVFKYDGERLSLSRTIEHGSEHNFLTLDTADVNRNGVAEIIVTSVVGDDLQSFILEYEGGEFRKTNEKEDWFFRVLDHPQDGPILIGQRMGSEGLFSGPIYRFTWKKKSFKKGPKMKGFPKEVRIFGLTLANIRRQGALDIVMLDDEDRLRILASDGKLLWKSRERFGGTDNSYDTKKMKNPQYRTRGFGDFRVYIPGRVIVKDLDGDKLDEVIINKNNLATRLLERVRIFETGEVHSLIWDAGTLSALWKTREINGYFSDYQVKDADNDGEEELVVAVVNYKDIYDRKGTSNLLFYRLF